MFTLHPWPVDWVNAVKGYISNTIQVCGHKLADGRVLHCGAIRQSALVYWVTYHRKNTLLDPLAQ